MVDVPFLPLSRMNSGYVAEFLSRLPELIETDSLILGRAVSEFEAEFASYCGVSSSIGVANGFDGLRACLLACGIGAGDEVIVPANTFIASLLAVSSVGATPVPLEPNEETLCLDETGLDAALSKRTRAIIPVHLYGRIAHIDEIAAFAEANKLCLIEDAAQAHGAIYKGRRAGALGDAAAFSFYPGKNLGALGDAGAVTTNSVDLAQKVRLIRNYGSTEKYVHEIKEGQNSRLDTLQALFLSIKLRDLERSNAERRRLAKIYMEGIRHDVVGLPAWPTVADAHVWHLFVIRSRYRDALKEHLWRAGISTHVHYPVPPHRQGAYSGFFSRPFPFTERLHQEVLSLPLYPGLSWDEQQHVIGTINDWNP